MNHDIAMRWVADLRTNPPQCTGMLHDGAGYCCLGRLCVVLGVEFLRHGELYVPESDPYESELLPEDVKQESGLRTRDGRSWNNSNSLVEMNDSHMTFREIADFIEQHWQEL